MGQESEPNLDPAATRKYYDRAASLSARFGNQTRPPPLIDKVFCLFLFTKRRLLPVFHFPYLNSNQTLMRSSPKPVSDRGTKVIAWNWHRGQGSQAARCGFAIEPAQAAEKA